MSDIIDDINIPDWMRGEKATEEELIENEVGYVAGPHIRMNGKRGLFVSHPDELEAPVVRGVICSKFEGQLLFGGENSRLFPNYDGWVCRNDYKQKAQPRVNENAPKWALKVLQENGGGVECSSCDLRKFGENDERPDCGSVWALVFLDDRYDETRPLFLKGTSISAMHEFLKGSDFKNPKTGELMPPMIRRVELKMVEDKKDGKAAMSFYKVQFKALGYLTDQAQFEQLRRHGLDQLKVFAQAAVAAPRPKIAALLGRPTAQAALPAGPADLDDVPQDAGYDGFDDYVPEPDDAF